MKNSQKTAILLAVLFLMTGAVNGILLSVSADFPALDGKYAVPFDSDMPAMGLSAFENKEKTAVVEKIGENWYLTLSVNADVVSDLKMLGNEAKVGEIVRKDGPIERHTYTVTKEQLSGTLRFSTRVTAMDRTVEFTVVPESDTARRIGDADPLGERPALFVPVIDTTASDSEVEKGSTYLIPEATATLGTESLPVSVKAYYMENGTLTELEPAGKHLIFTRVGEYQLVYRAESDRFQTSHGQNTCCEVRVRLISKIGAGTVARIEDPDGMTEEGVYVQASVLTSGELYEAAARTMQGYADRFQVIQTELYRASGEPYRLNGEVMLYLRADDTLNRKDITVYYLCEDGSLKEYACENYGRYVRVRTADMGSYILCVEGVPFRMPMWGYAVIAGGVVVLLTAVFTACAVIRHKRRHRNETKKTC